MIMHDLHGNTNKSSKMYTTDIKNHMNSTVVYDLLTFFRGVLIMRQSTVRGLSSSSISYYRIDAELKS